MAAAIAAAAIGAASAILSGVSSNRAKRNRNENLLSAQGRRSASIDAEAAWQQVALTPQAREFQEVHQRNQLRIDSAAMAESAHAEVNAAAAGTSGQSVDLSVMAAEEEAGRRQGSLERERQADLRALEETSRAINVSAEASKQILQLDARKTGKGLAEALRWGGRMAQGSVLGLFD